MPLLVSVSVDIYCNNYFLMKKDWLINWPLKLTEYDSIVLIEYKCLCIRYKCVQMLTLLKVVAYICTTYD